MQEKIKTFFKYINKLFLVYFIGHLKIFWIFDNKVFQWKYIIPYKIIQSIYIYYFVLVELYYKAIDYFIMPYPIILSLLSF